MLSSLSMRKYLYLKREHVNTWVNGGRVPISLASKHLSSVREGTKTPDENLIHESPVNIASLDQYGFHFENVRKITFTGNRYNGKLLPSFTNASYYKDDGLVLSFCNRKSSSICSRLGHDACIVIDDIEQLKAHLDDQIGVVSHAADCTYTSDHQRNHFLKFKADEWQQEYRLFWPICESRWVSVPPGTGRRIKI